MFDTVLVANRGEIARRVIRTLRRMGIRSVAVFSAADTHAPHVAEADEAVFIGPPAARESYLHHGRILEAARVTGAQAIHPGYGFLSESAVFARACQDAGLVFVGPPPEAIELMGDKIAAKRTAEKAGVPVVPGVHEPALDDDALVAAAERIGFPLLVKAAAGGGGKGMRVVDEPGTLPDALAAARREASAAFSDGTLLLERYIQRPRHIEIQVLFDGHEGSWGLWERECTLQRRYQKIVEEAPSALLDDDTRARMDAAATRLGQACGYVGAGTVEFIVSAERPTEFFFLEMNTRLQVEHPVTELVWDLDLVEWQLRVAAGQRLPAGGQTLTGHAVEARVYAEAPERGFLPTGGRVLAYREPRMPGVRVDSGVALGTIVGSDYDPMLAKVIAHGADRAEALARLDSALGQFVLLGVATNVAFLRALLSDPAVRDATMDTGTAEAVAATWRPPPVPDDALAAAGLARLWELEPRGERSDPFEIPGGWRVGEHAWTPWRMRTPDGDEIEVRVRGRADAAQVAVGDGAAMRAWVEVESDQQLRVGLDERTVVFAYAQDGDVAEISDQGVTWRLREREPLAAARHADDAGGPLVAPMPGTVTVVNVAAGDKVRAGQTLLVVEAMKMEHAITAAVGGTVAELPVKAGDSVELGQSLALVEPDPEDEESTS